MSTTERDDGPTSPASSVLSDYIDYDSSPIPLPDTPLTTDEDHARDSQWILPGSERRASNNSTQSELQCDREDYGTLASQRPRRKVKLPQKYAPITGRGFM